MGECTRTALQPDERPVHDCRCGLVVTHLLHRARWRRQQQPRIAAGHGGGALAKERVRAQRVCGETRRPDRCRWWQPLPWRVAG